MYDICFSGLSWNIRFLLFNDKLWLNIIGLNVEIRFKSRIEEKMIIKISHLLVYLSIWTLFAENVSLNSKMIRQIIFLSLYKPNLECNNLQDQYFAKFKKNCLSSFKVFVNFYNFDLYFVFYFFPKSSRVISWVK